MAHIGSVGSAMFSDLSINLTDVVPASFNKSTPQATFDGYFTTAMTTETAAVTTYKRIGNIRSFPAIGTPANIVKVPTYGQATSNSIQGQADAPQIEIDLNYVATDWEAADALKIAFEAKKQHVFRFTLLNAEPASYDKGTAGIGTVDNSSYYWIGKMEALLITPSLTDATTAKLTISIQSPYYGAFTAA
jgi:hypothetical protein